MLALSKQFQNNQIMLYRTEGRGQPLPMCRLIILTGILANHQYPPELFCRYNLLVISS